MPNNPGLSSEPGRLKERIFRFQSHGPSGDLRRSCRPIRLPFFLLKRPRTAILPLTVPSVAYLLSPQKASVTFHFLLPCVYTDLLRFGLPRLFELNTSLAVARTKRAGYPARFVLAMSFICRFFLYSAPSVSDSFMLWKTLVTSSSSSNFSISFSIDARCSSVTSFVSSGMRSNSPLISS